ncbi:1-(5-phosphoribosyl)-5-amino-4-imidazole-carboxylate carboxylase [candidate division WOR-3 bacterium 4484_100]|uniref:1-(5-phosphoribosyl)-5-amino-4-imidazole-carboxylate carboxylase n=1 Tax=candidate division WOR-3 bacterium 4484_100 TaxID=1936077 RepID=A0A1V4QGS8_UNCW3|nr:MAG: 1-(5-phosphoribosyl)-5-amino-4-imidazole-carboxylate carboxylase [candidate division WOR-3 bacterium 4484_100]
MEKEKIFIDPYDDLGYAKLDLHREKRKGFPEVVFCEGKTESQILKIAARFTQVSTRIMFTRVGTKLAQALKKRYKKGHYYEDARVFFIGSKKRGKGLITVLTGGTADIPVAEEAAVTAEIMGSKVERIYDVGVAGLHRILAFRKKVQKARVLIVVAGMDGVLASVAGGLFSKPIIAVPTSIGYGLSLKGIAPLLTMLNSCAPGVAVVNIDNGFGAGYIASIINHL